MVAQWNENDDFPFTPFFFHLFEVLDMSKPVWLHICVTMWSIDGKNHYSTRAAEKLSHTDALKKESLRLPITCYYDSSNVHLSALKTSFDVRDALKQVN